MLSGILLPLALALGTVCLAATRSPVPEGKRAVALSLPLEQISLLRKGDNVTLFFARESLENGRSLPGAVKVTSCMDRNRVLSITHPPRSGEPASIELALDTGLQENLASLGALTGGATIALARCHKDDASDHGPGQVISISQLLDREWYYGLCPPLPRDARLLGIVRPNKTTPAAPGAPCEPERDLPGRALREESEVGFALPMSSQSLGSMTEGDRIDVIVTFLGDFGPSLPRQRIAMRMVQNAPVRGICRPREGGAGTVELGVNVNDASVLTLALRSGSYAIARRAKGDERLENPAVPRLCAKTPP